MERATLTMCITRAFIRHGLLMVAYCMAANSLNAQAPDQTEVPPSPVRNAVTTPENGTIDSDSTESDGTQVGSPATGSTATGNTETEEASSVSHKTDEVPEELTKDQASASSLERESADAVILVVGAGGKEEYQKEFDAWAAQWQQLAKRQEWAIEVIRKEAEIETTPKDRLQASIQSFSDKPRLWLVLIGHGTYAVGKAKFNLPGPDVSSKELSDWLKVAQGQVIAINCSSSSSPFVSDLGAQGRVVVTATRSGNEVNFSRFGRFLSQAVNDLSIDIDHDKEVSLLEAFLAATAQTERFYEEDARLTTEHALLDDNGDQAGITADFYRGIRPVKKAAKNVTIDGNNAARIIVMTSPDSPVFTEKLNAERLAIESKLDELRKRRPKMIESEYLDELEKLMLDMAKVYETAESNP